MAYIAAIHKQRGSQGAVLDPFGDVGRRPVSGASAYSRPSVGEEESKRKKFTDVSGVFFSPFSSVPFTLDNINVDHCTAPQRRRLARANKSGNCATAACLSSDVHDTRKCLRYTRQMFLRAKNELPPKKTYIETPMCQLCGHAALTLLRPHQYC